MKRLDAGASGTPTAETLPLDAVEVAEEWREIIAACIGNNPLRPVQVKALASARMLETRRHLVVCSPTNSGKSLIGHLALVEALRAGRRAVLLEPLRSLAQEKADELAALLPLVDTSPTSAAPPKLHLSTGDYRLENETFQDPPPKQGELIVATPERFEAILRNASNQKWVASVGCVVIDEAHVIGTAHRGPTLELLVATLLGSRRPPRLVLLSATAGEPERLQAWLSPCDLIQEHSRTPPLSVEVWGLEEGEDTDSVLVAGVQESLAVEGASALVFVYRRSSSVSLAARLEGALGQTVLGYHSGMSAAARKAVRQQFAEGSARCVVATTALAMGVNLPATHVYVRDTTFFGHGRVGVDEVLQMVGRAGRGEREGHAVVLVRPGDSWSDVELAEALRTQALPPLRSAFETAARGAWRKDPGDSQAAAQVVASCLSRAGEAGLSADELRALLMHSLAGPALGTLVDPALRWLEDPSRLVAHETDGKHRLTVLGERGVHAVLPLDFVAGFGQLLRDLLWLDPKDRLLEQWSALDHLLVMSLLTNRRPTLRRFSEKLSEQVDGWHESCGHGEKSLIFREWITGNAAASKADELFGSLGIASANRAGAARKVGYVAMLGAIVLDERSRGTQSGDLERRWGIAGLEGAEESWRDTALWLLAGQAQLCELRSVYHHLLEHCEADAERIRRVKKALGRMRHQVFDLLERLKYCSPLGPILRGVRRTQGGSKKQLVGAQTLRRLEEAGVTSLKELATLDAEALTGLGVQMRFAKQIRAYVRQRLR